jgi:hypothetical protein
VRAVFLVAVAAVFAFSTGCGGDDDNGSGTTTTTVPSTSTTLALDDYEATAPPRGGDVILDQLAEKCQAGDMEACDQLYDDSDVDSEYEVYGNSCGGRLSDDNVEYCVDVFGEGNRE